MGLFNTGSKFKMNKAKFIESIQSLGYTATDYVPTKQFNGMISCCNTNCNIVFYEFSEIKFAKYACQSMETRIMGKFTKTEIKSGNKHRITAKANDRYLVISRLENTVVCVDCSIKYQHMLDGILKQVGY